MRAAGGSGVLAVLAFGLTLLVRSFFFVLLGASEVFAVRQYAVATVLILRGLLVAAQAR